MVKSIIIVFASWYILASATMAQPILITPEDGAILDNGCYMQAPYYDYDYVDWYFEWEPVANAAYYHLIVMRTGATLPAIDEEQIYESSYLHHKLAYISHTNLTGWHWRVRAWIPPIDTFDGYWTGLSEERGFEVEPVGTDCCYIRLIYGTSISFEAIQGGELPQSEYSDFCNKYQININWSMSDDQEWLDLNTTSSYSICAFTNAFINTTDLDHGVYYATILIESPEATNTPQEIDVTYTISPLLEQPQIDSVGDPGTGSELYVRWSQPEPEEVTHFQVYVRSVPGDYIPVSELIEADASEYYQYMIDGLNESQEYYIAVRAYNEDADIWSEYGESWPEKPTVPIFLVHGWREDSSIWNTMVNWLDADGFNHVYKVTSLDPCGVQNETFFSGNATMLAIFIENNLSAIESYYSQVGGFNVHVDKVDIIAHSMGGLISRRYCAPRFPGSRQVRNLVMLGTPNKGSELADRLISDFACPNGPAALEMSTPFMAAFNRLIPDNPITNYYAVYGTKGSLLSCPWGYFSRYVARPNDAVVSMYSAIKFDFNPLTYYNNNGGYWCHGDYFTDPELYSNYILGILDNVRGTKSGVYNYFDIPEDTIPQIAYIHENQLPAGTYVTNSFDVEANDNITVIAMANDSSTALSLISPSNTTFDSTFPGSGSSEYFYYNSLGIKGFFLENAEPGTWHWVIDAAYAISSPVQYSVLASFENNIIVEVEQNSESLISGDSLILNITVKEGSVSLTGLNISLNPIWNNTDTTELVLMYDDGLNGDVNPNDGIYGAILAPSDTGTVKYYSSIEGEASTGPIQRFHSFYAYWLSFICGDLNGDFTVNIIDIIFMINYKFQGGPPPIVMESADVNSDSAINILDIIYLIDYKFKSGPEPNCP